MNDAPADGGVIQFSRPETGVRAPDLNARFAALGLDGMRLLLPYDGIVIGVANQYARKAFKFRIDSGDWLSFSFCIRGRLLTPNQFDAEYHEINQLRIAVRDGSSSFCIPQGSHLVNVSLSGHADAFAAFAGCSRAELEGLVGGLGRARLSTKVVGSRREQLQHAVLRLVGCALSTSRDRFDGLRCRVNALEFALSALETVSELNSGRQAPVPCLPDRRRQCRIEHAASLLESADYDALSIGQVGRRLGFARRTFDRLFFERYGCTPSQHRSRVRNHRAVALLETGGLTVKEVAEQTGFSSASNLSRELRRRFGRSPREMRQARRD